MERGTCVRGRDWQVGRAKSSGKWREQNIVFQEGVTTQQEVLTQLGPPSQIIALPAQLECMDWNNVGRRLLSGKGPLQAHSRTALALSINRRQVCVLMGSRKDGVHYQRSSMSGGIVVYPSVLSGGQ
jgi:hypothetical protein